MLTTNINPHTNDTVRKICQSDIICKIVEEKVVYFITLFIWVQQWFYGGVKISSALVFSELQTRCHGGSEAGVVSGWLAGWREEARAHNL